MAGETAPCVLTKEINSLKSVGFLRLQVRVMYAETVLIGQTCGFDGTEGKITITDGLPGVDVFKRSVTIN